MRNPNATHHEDRRSTSSEGDVAAIAAHEPFSPDRLWRVEAVAKRFDVSRSALYELLRAGALRSLKVGGARRIPESAVREYIENGCSK